MVSTKKRGSVTLHVKTLLLTIPSPMNFSLFKENKADQAFGFGAGLVRIAKRQMLSTELVMLLVLPILLEVTPFALLRPREGASQGPSGLASFCMSQLVHVTTREFSNQVPLPNMDSGMIRYLFWSQFGSQKSNS